MRDEHYKQNNDKLKQDCGKKRIDNSHNCGLKREGIPILAHTAISGLRLRIYRCLWIRSARRTVICWVIPARSKSAWRVDASRVFLPAMQKLSLKWLMDFSTVTRILYVSSHSSVPLTAPGKARKFFSG